MPLSKKPGKFQTLLLQWQPPSRLLFTTLEEFKQWGPQAPPHMTVQLYEDLKASHGLVLARGDLINPQLINAAEVRAALRMYRPFSAGQRCCQGLQAQLSHRNCAICSCCTHRSAISVHACVCAYALCAGAGMLGCTGREGLHTLLLQSACQPDGYNSSRCPCCTSTEVHALSVSCCTMASCIESGAVCLYICVRVTRRAGPCWSWHGPSTGMLLRTRWCMPSTTTLRSLTSRHCAGSWVSTCRRSQHQQHELSLPAWQRKGTGGHFSGSSSVAEVRRTMPALQSAGMLPALFCNVNAFGYFAVVPVEWYSSIWVLHVWMWTGCQAGPGGRCLPQLRGQAVTPSAAAPTT